MKVTMCPILTGAKIAHEGYHELNFIASCYRERCELWCSHRETCGIKQNIVIQKEVAK
jgi:hypothetical protein